MDEPVQSYLGVVQRRWKLLLAITLIPTVVMIFLVYFVLTPVYEGKTSVIFPLKSSTSFMRRALTEMDIPVSGMQNLLTNIPSLYNHIAIIESRTLAERVYYYLLNEKDIDLLQTYDKILHDRKLDDEHRMRAVFKLMQKRVRVDDKDRGMAVITFVHTDPVIAAETSIAYVNETLAFLAEVNRNSQTDLVDFLEDRQVEVETNLQAAELEIQLTKEATGILSVEEQARQLITSYADIESLVAQAEIDYQGSLSLAGGMASAGMDMEDYYNWLNAGETPEGDAPVPAINALSDTTIAELRAELATLELERQQATLWATPGNPEIVLLDSQIEALKRELYREFSGYYDASTASLLVESSAYQAQLNVAEEILAELDSRLETFPPEERHLIELERDRDVQESIFLVITQELEQARINVMRDEQPFTILDEALVPQKPVRPRKLILTLAAFGIAFWLGIFIIFGVDSSTRRRSIVGG